jgi:hypothetical protein
VQQLCFLVQKDWMERSATNWQKLILTGGAIYWQLFHFREFEAERSIGSKWNQKKFYRTSRGLSFDVHLVEFKLKLLIWPGFR